MEISVLVLLFFLVAVALFVWWVIVLIEALRTPAAQWERAGQNQLLYVLLMVLVGIVGTIAYVVVARPQLRAVTPPPA